MRIKYAQKFHSIGQGLFYSSSLQLDDNIPANVIFDCGSDNIKLINNEIDKYHKHDIDILIISHLHYDHISGLEHFLQTKSINTVILPYLFPNERFLLQLFNYNKPEWYKTFLANPYSYLNENEKIKHIIVINGDNENNDCSVPDDTSTQGENIQIQLGDTSTDTRKQIEKDEAIHFVDKLSLKNDKGYVLISQQMYFSFFNYKIDDEKKVIDFYKEIDNLRIANVKSISTNSKLIEIMKTDEGRELFKKSYEILKTDINITSLAAYQCLILPFNKKYSITIRSCSVFQDDFINNLFCCNCDGFIDGHIHGHFVKDYKYKYYFDCFCDYHKHCNCSKMIGTLLLGDIKLDYKIKKRKELFTYFKNLLPSVKLVQLSHHGAENGWSEKLITEVPKNTTYVASHQTTNKYHHPHKKVILGLAEHNRKYISVTENNEYYNRIEFSN